MMQQESNAKKSKVSVMSIQSMGSNLSNFSFLREAQGRQSYPNKESLRESLKYYMSVESDKKSDLYEKLISEEDVKKNPVYGSGLGRQFRPEQQLIQSGGTRRSYDGRYFDSDVSHRTNMPGSNITDENAKSLLQRYKLMHTCLCLDNKCEKDCPCYEATNDQCLIGMCCDKCIEYKDRLLETKRKLQKQGIDNLDDLKPCTCKKTKCNKKYCACYAAGRKCTNLCQCDQCTNCDFYDYEPQEKPRQTTYIDMEYDRKVEMPEKMDFEPVQFPDL